MSVTQKVFEDAIKSLHKKLDSILTDQKDFSATLTSISAELTTLKNEASAREAKISVLELKVEEQDARYELLDAKLLEMDVKSRSLNFVIHGLPNERQSQTAAANVSSLLADKMGITSDLNITKCYRMPNNKSNITSRKPRVAPIFVTVGTEKDIQTVFSSISNLKGTGITICTDLPPKLNTVRNELLTQGKALRDAGSVKVTRVKQKGAKLWLEFKSETSSEWVKA